jgi:hypothetical protein
MRPLNWVWAGGLLIILGTGWSAYLVYVVYPNLVDNCGSNPCWPVYPLGDQPGFWIRPATAVVGTVVLLIGLAKWLAGRRNGPQPIRPAKTVR